MHLYNPMDKNRLISGLHSFIRDLVRIARWDRTMLSADESNPEPIKGSRKNIPLNWCC